MGLFDRLRNFANRLIGRAETPPEISVDAEIPASFERAATPAQQRKPTLFERAKSFFGFGRKEPKQEQPFDNEQLTRMYARRASKEADTQERKDSIFRFRRTSERNELGRAFYRLTQPIWDKPGIPIEERDEAIRRYFKERYGMDDLNEIYDFVLEKNAQLLEAYRNTPNAEKYTLLKNIALNAVQV